MTTTYAVLTVVVIAAVTVALRFLPFAVFGRKKTPELVRYLGRMLPFAIMGMLVVFCLRGISFSQAPHALPEMISCAVVILLHVWKRNTLLSIIGGTVCYMLLVQLVF